MLRNKGKSKRVHNGQTLSLANIVRTADSSQIDCTFSNHDVTGECKNYKNDVDLGRMRGILEKVCKVVPKV